MNAVSASLLLALVAPSTYLDAHPVRLTATLPQTAFAKKTCAERHARFLFANVFYGTRTVFNGDVGTTVYISQLQWACEKDRKKTRLYEYLDSPRAAPGP